MKKKCKEDTMGMLEGRNFRYGCENFARIAKISQSKLGNFARLAKFRYLAKFTVPSEINQFRYLTYFSLG